MILPRKFLRMCRRNLRRPKVADSMGAEWTGGELLLRTLILRRLLRREVLGRDEKQVGLLLPPSSAAVLANAALAIDRRMAVNLNYTFSTADLNHCIRECGIRHVLTSRRAMEKLDVRVDAELVYLEDFKDKVTAADKAVAAAQTWLVPPWLLERWLGLTRIDADDLLTVIFTSGTTSVPKGVMLTHGNIGSNIEAFNSVIKLSAADVLLGILPLFHSFGYTVALWSVLSLDPKGVYHFTPLDPRAIGKLCREHAVTILLSTPTFLGLYERGCKPEDFPALEVVITGAEKLSASLAERFAKKFGLRPLEGYGTTELSPAVSVNIPPSRLSDPSQKAVKPGSVGRALPGIAVKTVDLETGSELGPGQSGMLLVSGPNVMKGYLNKPRETAKVVRNGWYETGDVATIDEEGFITITGRISRFSKIGGEMIPHSPIEEAILQVLGLDGDAAAVLVLGVPDAKKGERLVVLHTGLPEDPENICRRLTDAGLRPISIPAPNSFRQIQEFPLLGTGKVDLRRARELALELFPQGSG